MCIPANDTLRAASTATRPIGYSSTVQTVVPNITQPGADICINVTSRWDLRRCWASAGVYADLATYCANTNTGGSIAWWLAGYNMHVKDTYYVVRMERASE